MNYTKNIRTVNHVLIPKSVLNGIKISTDWYQNQYQMVPTADIVKLFLHEFIFCACVSKSSAQFRESVAAKNDSLCMKIILILFHFLNLQEMGQFIIMIIVLIIILCLSK
jgi:hypothetical protein